MIFVQFTLTNSFYLRNILKGCINFEFKGKILNKKKIFDQSTKSDIIRNWYLVTKL